jgi:gamma-glutamyltranspeptidase / glutathione hydrolase
MQYDPSFLPYPSARYPVYASRGMVATSSPLAASAGLQALLKGGNAVDAAVAAATALTVVEPTSNGIGSDAFALVWMKKEHKLYGLNASGWSPRDISLEKVLARNPPDGKMPLFGWTPTMVPGAPKAWAKLNKRFGRLPLTDVLAPAIDYAREGYPASPILSKYWGAAQSRYSRYAGDLAFTEWFKTFTPNGEAPRPGTIVKLPNHGDTLEKIAKSNADDFYKGGLMERIVKDSLELGGCFCKEDFLEYDAAWVEPAVINYRGYDVCEIPPNGQGIVALMALNILKEFEFTQKECAGTYHKQWEAMKLAFADGLHYITDPGSMSISYADLLQPAYGAMRSSFIGEKAGTPVFGTPPKGGTVYLCTADSEGNMVSYIQSNYMGFGSGIVVRGTGISLQNRGCDFSLNPADYNCLAPRKRSYHTIIPGFLMKDGEAVGPFGVMGGYMQPQGHVQVVMNLIDFHLNPQQALDAPRWLWQREGRFLVEPSFPVEIAKQLAARGHKVEISMDSASFGRGQIILRGPDGSLVGGTEKRTDGSIACY